MPHDRPADLDEATVQGLIDVGGMELFTELVDDFVPFADEALATIRHGVAVGSREAVAGAVHSIKSASASLGAMELSDVATQMETAAKGTDIAAVKALLPRFERAKAIAEAALIARSKR